MTKMLLLLCALTVSFISSGKTFVDGDGNTWQYQDSESGNITITSIPPVTNLVIPAYIESKPVGNFSASMIWYRTRKVGDVYVSERESVTSITIPSTVTNLGWRGFGSIAKVVVDPSNPKYEAFDNVLYEKQMPPDMFGDTYPNERSLLWCGVENTNLVLSTNVTAFGIQAQRGRYDNGGYGTGYSLPYQCEWGGNNLVSITVEEGNPAFCSIDGMLYMKPYISKWKDYTCLCRCPPAFAREKTIPAKIDSLSKYAFWGCHLKAIDVEPENEKFASIEGALYSKDGAQLLAIPGGCEEVKIASGTKEIVSLSLSPTLRALTIPDGVVSISVDACVDCDNLENVSIAKSVTDIGANAFRHCDKLEKVRIPNSVTNIGASAFMDCTSLGEVVMNGNAVTNIPSRCFCACSSLTSVVFSASLKSVGNQAFSGCCELRSVDLPNTLEVIESNAFAGAGLKELMLSGTELTVGESAFSSCSGLEVVNIDHSVKSIDPCAFVGCRFVSEYKLVDESAYYATTNRCLCDRKMEQLLFVPYTDTELIVPTGIVTIGSYACRGHENLARVILPGTLKRIEKSAFAECLNLNDVTIPMGTTYIGNYAFENCSGVQYVSLPHSVVHLGDGCFMGCETLSVVNTSTNLENIGWSCFEGCGSLEEIVIPSKVATLEDSTFSGCTNLKSCVIMKGVTIIEGDVWRNCSSLTNLLIPSSVQELEGAFCGCSNMVSISFVGNAPDIYDGGYREFSTTNFNDTLGQPVYWTETIGSTTWYHYGKRISGYLFKGTREELHVYVKPGSSGWIDEDVTGIPEEWPVDSSNGRAISYAATLEDPDIIYETRYKVPFKFIRLDSDEHPVTFTRYWYIGDEIEIPDAMGQEKSGFSFRGWSDGVDAYRTGEKYILKSDGVSFVPIWGSPTFVLRYDSNGGAGTMTNEEYVVGAEVVLQTNAFTITKREFLGWGEESDGPVKYVDGQRTIEIRPLLEDEVVLYAIWSEAKMEIGDYLDCPGLDFTTVDPSPWTGVSDVTHSTIGAMRSGCVTNGESVLSVSVSGEGKIEFWWKVSSETYKTFQIDYASFRVDGVEQSWIGGEIDWQHIVFDVAGDGQHTISWAYVKDKDGSDGNDCAWLDEVSWTPNAIPVDPIPDIGDSPSQAEVKAALDGSADTDLVKHITNGTEYVAYRTWAMNVKAADGNTTAGLQAVHDSENAWLSYALQTDKLISKSPTNGCLKISTMGHSPDVGWFDLTVSVDGVSVGTTASAENLKQVFGIEGASTLDEDAFSAANVDVIFGTPVDGKIKCSVAPKDEKASSFFMKMRMMR